MQLINATKTFSKKNKKITILDDININFKLGKIYMIIGNSGAGKTTLINILGLLDTLDSGYLKINGSKITNLNDDELSLIRLRNIGMIFQDYYLNPRLNAEENILIATLINPDMTPEEREKSLNNILEYFNLSERRDHYPEELSGGEQQRIAIARALINNPDYILADEPTGSLDSLNAKKVLKILSHLARSGKCVIMVTHDYRNIIYADYVYKLSEGKLVEENKNAIYKKYFKEEKF